MTREEFKMVRFPMKATKLMRTTCLVTFILLGLTVIWAAPVWADLSVEIVNGYNLVVDSNVTAPPTYAPKSAYIGARICNTSATDTLYDVVAYVGDYIDGSNDTPGIFPVLDSAAQSAAWDTAHPHILDTGSYSLTIEADETGTADGTRYIGTLGPGECRIQYWLFSYPQCVNIDSDGDGFYESNSDVPPCDVSITGGIKPEDDLVLDYDVWASTSTAGVSTVVETRDFTMRNEISASANKIWPNTSSKVPDEYLEAIESVIGWGTLGPDGQPLTSGNPIYPGQRVITTQGIWYDLGNVVHGFDNDNDLIVDQNAWLQPVGDPGLFDADCFRMVRNYGIVIVKLKGGGEALIPFEDQLYFTNLPDNTGVVGLVYYQFIATDEGCSADMTPYQEAASGYDNEKFSSDYGLGLQLYSGSFGTAMTLGKTDGVSSTSAGSTLTYTMIANNINTGVNLGAPDFGVPLVFQDSIPAGTTFVAGSADDSPTTNLIEPTGTGSYSQGYTDRDDNLDECTINYQVNTSSFKIFYSDDNGTSWSTTEPAAASVTDIRWMLITDINLDGSHDGDDCVAPNGTYDDGTIDTSLPAGMSATVRFQVTVDSDGGPIICNTMGLGFGEASAAVEAEDCTLVTGNNTLSGTVFEDDAGTTGTYGNGTQDGDEAGIGSATDGVTVTLYYDLNGDGEYDSSDIQYATTTADANGDYSFTSLPDGPFLVVAKKYDGTPAPGDSSDNAVNDFNAGWGNTSTDPDLPLTTDQGILKMTENSTTVTLAVNIDLDRSDGSPQAVSTVDFGFAPPLEVTKGISGSSTTVDEGRDFSYSIALENRLPGAGVQGPTGCEFTEWSRTGTNGSPEAKSFTDFSNAFDASTPNRKVASALITGGANRFVVANGFDHSDQPGNITKVEALVFAYYNIPLDDDSLHLEMDLGGITVDTILSTAKIDSYIGEPDDTSPNSAISWNITSLRPGGGSWSWSDFASLDLTIDPTKAASADTRTFYLDAVGIRVTTDVDCEAGESTTLQPVPLEDDYDESRFEFVSADPVPASVNTTTGVILWDDVGPILPGNSATVTVTLRPYDVDGTVTGTCSAGSEDACNEVRTDYSTKNVYYADGRLANDDSDEVPVNIVGRGEIRGTVWSDANNDGWPDNDGESGIPNVPVTLYTCMTSDQVTQETHGSNSKTCEEYTSGNYWGVFATTVTDSSGDYEFLGLTDGYYVVEINDTDGAPETGNSAPYGSSQTAEPDDDQGLSGTSPTFTADGTIGICAGGCDNTWGDISADLDDQFLMDGDSEEAVSGVDFGYYQPNAVIYGNVWHDVNGDATTDPGDIGLSGFTVQLYSDPNGDGDPSDGTVLATTTTNSNGDYDFSDLSADDYVVVVTPPTLLTQVWTETVESTGGTGSLNNRIPVTVAAGEFSGSHDFGYTYDDTSSIGDTLYIDFDADGIQDSTEDPIPDITVWLYSDVDRDGNIDAGVDVLLATDVTDSNGNYLFEVLAYGSYIVKVDTTDPDFPTSTTATADPDTNAASIGDQIWFDADGDGTLDAGEVGIPNVVVLLYEDSNGNGSLDMGIDNIVAATSTDVNGEYLFTALNASDYFVDVDETSLPSSDFAITTTDPASTLITLTDRTISTSVLTADAGYSPSGTNYAAGGRVWYDDNPNDTIDDGEAGIGDIDITITGGTTVCTAGNPCYTTTDETGNWSYTGLVNGETYTVTVDTTDLTSGLNPTNASDTNSESITISSADDMDVDFGYKYDPDNDENYIEDDADEPTGTIDGTVFADGDGDKALDSGEEMGSVTVNLLDVDGNLVATTTTASDGTYTFSGVPIGIYSVQSVDPTGTRYSTLFLSPGEAFADMNVIYNATSLATPDSQSSVSVGGVHDNLMQDFGYQRFLGAIGDTVYLDVNENADQDFGEPGIDGVTVDLYLWDDADNDGVIDSGELTLEDTTTTTADDPLTAEDESGKYLFPNLNDPPVDQYYVVQVDTSTLPGIGYTLIGDPDTDGTPCPLLPDPDVVGDEYPPPGVCDSLQIVDGYSAGINYLGADFGYQIDGAGYAAIGDYVWIDSDDDGVFDGGESGIPYITVYFDDDNDGSLDWTDGNSNGVWDSGEGERWVETDTGGYYVFTTLADGTYNYVKVLTSDGDWPPGLPTTPVYEVRSDNDDSLNSSANVVISGGVVTSIVDGDGDTTDTCTGCDLNVDFGYRYTGTNTLSGTVCIDDASGNGYCGATDTTYSGVDAGNGEVAISSLIVSFYGWGDDGDNSAWAGDGTLDSGDTFTFLGSTPTDANGDYFYNNLPDDVIVVFGILASENLDLTTTNLNTSVEDANVISHQLYEGTAVYNGETVTVLGRQALDLSGDADDDIKDLDFAFDSLIDYDFGDLPDSGATDYNATLLSSGARHVVTGSSIHLGAGVTTESDGTDSATASADGNDDGVTLPSTAWITGTNASATVNASDDGWLLGWIDFNQDGDFNDANEQVANQAVAAGDNTITFYVPFYQSVSGTYSFNARFRIYPEQPLLTSYKGAALSSLLQPTTGEVEDYQWEVNVTYVLISDIQAYQQGDKIVVEWETAAEIGTRGFNLIRQDVSGKNKKLNNKPIPSVITPHGGTYQVLDQFAELGGSYVYHIEELQASGGKKTYGPYILTVAQSRQSTDGSGLPADSDISVDFTQENYASAPRGMDKLVYDPDYKDPKKEPKPMKISKKEASKSKSKKKDSPVIDVLETYDEIKIIVSKPGFYWVGADIIADIVGVELETVTGYIANNQVRMSNMGKQVAYLPADDHSGLYFYGEAYTSIYTDENVYWIQLQSGVVKGDVNGDAILDKADLAICMDVLTGKISDLRSDYADSGADVNGNSQVDMNEVAYIRHALSGVMGDVTGNVPSASGEGNTFTVTENFEEDTFWVSDVDIATEDFWFWEQFWNGNPIFGINSFPIEVLGVSSETHSAKLTVNLQGLSNHSHQLAVILNAGTANELLLGDIAWEGFGPRSEVFEFNQEKLFEGENAITIQGAFTSAGEVFGVDSIDISYQKTYTATDNSLICNSSDNAVITISGFTNTDIALFEISDPLHPKRSTGADIDIENGTLTFIPAGENIPYIAIALDTQKLPDAMIYDEPSDLKNDQNSAQYIIITADELAEGAQELAAYRETRGLSTKVANLTDVFDEFSNGIYDPYAIKDFIAYALNSWSSAPQYVVLVGHGTYDFKEVLSRFALDLKNLIPVVMTRTPYGTHASDNLYADVDGDSVPDIAIGRIPAKTTAEVQAVVAKIAAYESSLATSDKPVVLLADNPDAGPFNDFPRDSDQVATLISGGHSIDKVYYPGLSKSQMREQFVNSINSDNGAFLVNYIGHGGFNNMSDFFSTADLGLLHNSQYPVYVAMTCLVNGFDFPFIDAFGEAFMLREGSGSVASWAPSGLSVNSEAVQMNKELFTAIFTDNIGDLGHAVKRALERYHDSGPLSYPYMIRINNLLGDPALELN